MDTPDMACVEDSMHALARELNSRLTCSAPVKKYRDLVRMCRQPEYADTVKELRIDTKTGAFTKFICVAGTVEFDDHSQRWEVLLAAPPLLPVKNWPSPTHCDWGTVVFRDVTAGHLKEAVQKTAALIEDPVRWCQHTSARRINVKGVGLLYETAGAMSPRACQWCLTGALHRVSNWDDLCSEPPIYSACITCFDAKANELHGLSSIRVNDTLTHDDVMRLLCAVHLAPADELAKACEELRRQAAELDRFREDDDVFA